jgi:hypothetical protein
MACAPSPTAKKEFEMSDLPKCPMCGKEATFQYRWGTLWESNAHYWRLKVATAPPAESKPGDRWLTQAAEIARTIPFPPMDLIKAIAGGLQSAHAAAMRQAADAIKKFRGWMNEDFEDKLICRVLALAPLVPAPALLRDTLVALQADKDHLLALVAVLREDAGVAERRIAALEAALRIEAALAGAKENDDARKG